MKYDKKIIGERIKTLRVENGHSQKELCLLVNRGRDIISKWENGRELPSLSILLQICEYYNCELGYILGEYNCKTRIKSDIQKETGLSETALDILMYPELSKSYTEKNLFDSATLRSIVNLLLSTDAGKQFLKQVNTYLHDTNKIFSITELDNNYQNNGIPSSKLKELVKTNNLINTQKALETLKTEYDSLQKIEQSR